MYMHFFTSFEDTISRKVRCLAARWMVGAEDEESITAMTQFNYIIDKEPDFHRTVYQRPVLTVEERDQLYRLVGRNI